MALRLIRLAVGYAKMVAFIIFRLRLVKSKMLTYVNTAVRTFFVLANRAYTITHNCTLCVLPYDQWTIQWSVIIASFYPGTIVGFLAVPILATRLGVRRSLMVTCIPAILGCLVQVTAPIAANTGSLLFDTVMCLGRLLVGVQAGSSLCLLPLFITEISPIEHRGILSTFQQASQSLSTLIGFIVGSEHLIGMGDHRFEWMQLIAIIPAVLFLVMLIFLPETPRHCFLRMQDYVSAGKAVTFYHGHRDVSAARRELLLETGGSRYGHEQWNATVIKGFILGCVAAISSAFTADDLIDTFSTFIIHHTGGDTADVETDLKSELLTISLGVILFVSSIFGSLLIYKYGRRPLLIAGLVGTSLSNSIVALSTLLKSPILTAVAFALTKCFIGLGAGAPAWFLTSELVPPGLTSICQATSTGLLLVATGIIMLTYLKLEIALSAASILVVASGPALISAALLFVFLPETRNKPYMLVSAELDNHLFSGLHASLLFGSKKTDYGSLNSDN
ncbi:Putative metabolite transport protein YwtG [Toxocara canis]|uniref:Putative metabolite transport protein YwtG n=1 Tax=Toxocara canis TaxID=6265 RepID=A0A0B2UYI0_TOXCA|nr:Putative metabolite transport protein YwtG [Toxocara canis]